MMYQTTSYILYKLAERSIGIHVHFIYVYINIGLTNGEVLLSLSSELSLKEASNQRFNNFCSVPTCWSL